MVTVTLSCAQTQEEVEKAIDLAGELARANCVEQQKLAEMEFAQNKSPGSPFGG